MTAEAQVKEQKPKTSEAVREDLVEVEIPKEVGTVYVNEKAYVGKVKVPKKQAEDISRIIEDRMETIRAIHQEKPEVSIKSVQQIESLFLADLPDGHQRKGQDNDYGKLPDWQWEKLDDNFKKRLLELRKAKKGY